MIGWLVIGVGGLAVILLLLNAVLSFAEQGRTWRSWFRLNVALYAGMVTLIALNIVHVLGWWP